MNTNTHPLQQYRLRQLLLGFLISLSVISCVTINIYFPAAAAEQAAEKIVDEVLNSGEPQIKPAPENNSGQPQTFYEYNKPPADNFMITLVDFFIPVAQAGGNQANISIDSAQIRSIRNNMARRQSKLKTFYQSGAVGFTNNGFIAQVSGASLSVKQKSTVNKLVKAENKDRMALYKEIANANGHPEWQADIQKTFSKTWINKISSGWMYQTSAGQWKKK